MNGGYVAIDMKGLDSRDLPTTISGIYDKLAEALSTGKLCIIHNVKLSGADTAPASAITMQVGNVIRVSLGQAAFLVSSNDQITVVE